MRILRLIWRMLVNWDRSVGGSDAGGGFVRMRSVR